MFMAGRYLHSEEILSVPFDFALLSFSPVFNINEQKGKYNKKRIKTSEQTMRYQIANYN